MQEVLRKTCKNDKCFKQNNAGQKPKCTVIPDQKAFRSPFQMEMV